ncbi:cysteine peptidase family C39 domain-containing protein [Longitalea arenae]|uniref:cysteine peptidase family C39 domain-containing protein n=1 Tax=Longitalea arenae TaxID=2812558 RepID=UPI001F085320|nr:cysteine peptidase family C39 domain-containing protein [Longitalea arenae]
MRTFPFYAQHDIIDCGPTCLKMIAKYYGKDYSLQYLRELCFLTREGVSLLSINDAAENLGFRTMMAYLSFDRLVNDSPLPCILHWNQDHFIVLHKVKKKALSLPIPPTGS